MKKNVFSFSWIFLFSLCSLFFIACSEDATNGLTTDLESENASAETVNAFVDQALYRIQESGGIGRFGCFELVFPITITLPDDTTVEITSYETFRTTLQEWRENNTDFEGRPSLAFPIEVVSEDGELISLADKAELKELKRSCGGGTFSQHGYHGHSNHGCSCFSLVFPISIQFPDESTLEVADRSEMKDAIRDWKENSADAEEQPTLLFPIDVALEDGTIQSVIDEDALRDLKDSCQ